MALGVVRRCLWCVGGALGTVVINRNAVVLVVVVVVEDRSVQASKATPHR